MNGIFKIIAKIYFKKSIALIVKEDWFGINHADLVDHVTIIGKAYTFMFNIKFHYKKRATLLPIMPSMPRQPIGEFLKSITKAGILTILICPKVKVSNSTIITVSFLSVASKIGTL